MNERRMQFLVGVVVFATMIIGGLLITLNSGTRPGWLPWGTGTYRVIIQVPEAPGIGPDTPVRRNGIPIGRVEELRDEEVVEIVARIDADKKIPTNDQARISTSLLGDTTINFSRRPGPPTGQYLESGSVVPGYVVPSPFEDFTTLTQRFEATADSLGRAGDEVAELAGRINNAFGQDRDQQRLGNLLDKMETAMDDFSTAMQSMNDLIGNPQTRADFREAVTEVRETMQKARETMDSMDGAVASAQRNLQNLEGLTQPLGDRGDEIADSIVSGVEGIDRLLEEFTVLTRSITTSEGTIGLLLRDRRLYDNLNQMIVNANVVVVRINDLMRYLNERIPPVVEDARVFMDKIAREPGRLVGGAFNRGPGIK